MLSELAAGLLFAFLGLVCAHEWHERRAPNWLVLPALLSTAAWRVLLGSWQFAVLWWVAFFFMWLVGLMGGGDARVLMVLVNVWPEWRFLAWLGAGLVLVYAMWLVIRERKRLTAFLQTLPAIAMSASRDTGRTEIFLLPVTGIVACFYVAERVRMDGGGALLPAMMLAGLAFGALLGGGLAWLRWRKGRARPARVAHGGPG